MASSKKGKITKILIVEDDEEMQRLYEDIFRDRSGRYKIEIAGDSIAAFGRLREKKFDLVILDIIMEPVTGDIFYALIRDDKRITDIPVLVVSVLNPTTLEHLKKIDNVAFLQKPVTEEQLFENIDRMLKKSR